MGSVTTQSSSGTSHPPSSHPYPALPALPAHGCHKSLVLRLFSGLVSSLMDASPLVLQFFHCTCPTKPQSRSAALHPAWAAVWTLAAKTTAALWSSVSLCPSVLWFVHCEPHHCLQAWGSAFRSLPSPSLTLHLVPYSTKKKKKTRGSQEYPLLLPASFTLNMLTSTLILFPFSLVCTREVWGLYKGGLRSPSFLFRAQSLSWTTFCFSTSFCDSPILFLSQGYFLILTGEFLQSWETHLSARCSSSFCQISFHPPSHPNVSKMWPTFIFPSSSLLIPQTTAICLLPPCSAERNLPRPWMTSRLPTEYLSLLTPTNPLLGLYWWLLTSQSSLDFCDYTLSWFSSWLPFILSEKDLFDSCYVPGYCRDLEFRKTDTRSVLMECTI